MSPLLNLGSLDASGEFFPTFSNIVSFEIGPGGNIPIFSFSLLRRLSLAYSSATLLETLFETKHFHLKSQSLSKSYEFEFYLT